MDIYKYILALYVGISLTFFIIYENMLTDYLKNYYRSTGSSYVVNNLTCTVFNYMKNRKQTTIMTIIVLIILMGLIYNGLVSIELFKMISALWLIGMIIGLCYFIWHK